MTNEELDQGARLMTDHEYGPNGHIVDAFIEHLRSMTPNDWGKVYARWAAAWAGAGSATWVAAQNATWDAVWGDEWDAKGMDTLADTWADTWDAEWDAKGMAAGDATWAAAGVAAGVAAGAPAGAAVRGATWEIQGADLLRERGQPFFFLPMFGFADEKAVLAALQTKEDV